MLMPKRVKRRRPRAGELQRRQRRDDDDRGDNPVPPLHGAGS